MNTTTDLSLFGYFERRQAIKLLAASIEQGFPEHFQEKDVLLMYNDYSHFVFFINSKHEICMLNGKKLESFYICPVCGYEAFQENMNKKACCRKYQRKIKNGSP